MSDAMTRSKSTSILESYKARIVFPFLGVLAALQLLVPQPGAARIFIDINAPSIQRIQIAITDFGNLSEDKAHPEFSTALPQVLSNDLDLSGYFRPIEKEAFLQKADTTMAPKEINFKDWSVIGAELLLKGTYTCIGRNVEVEFRLYDVFWGRQIMGKRVLGKVDDYRALMHRLGNQIIALLTGREGMFLSRFAFVGTSTGNKEIYVCDFDGHNLRQITSDKSIALFPRWSPSGDKILYNSYKDGGAKLYMMDLRSKTNRMISSRKGLNTGATWAPDGKQIVLTLSLESNPDIYMIDPSGKILNRMTSHWGIDVSPSLSPDGNKVAFVSNRSGSPQIYVRDLLRGREERLTFEGKYNTSPSWSSLNRIAYAGMTDGKFDIYTMEADGSRLMKLTADQGNNEDPCWSPDGRYLVFSSSREGRYHIYIMNANGQNQQRITYGKGEQTSPSWSPY